VIINHSIVFAYASSTNIQQILYFCLNYGENIFIIHKVCFNLQSLLFFSSSKKPQGVYGGWLKLDGRCSMVNSNAIAEAELSWSRSFSQFCNSKTPQLPIWTTNHAASFRSCDCSIVLLTWRCYLCCCCCCCCYCPRTLFIWLCFLAQTRGFSSFFVVGSVEGVLKGEQ